MRNLFLFFRRFSLLLFFLLLQALAIGLLVKYSRSHQAVYMQLAYELTGKINTKASKIERYFNLTEENKKLAAENNRLLNTLPISYTSIDTNLHIVVDTVKWDSTSKQRKYVFRAAEVSSNSVAFRNNYVQLQRGKNQGVFKDQAVTSPAGIVGIVVDASNNFSEVMSLLHHNSRTSVMLQKDRTSGILIWDGINPNLLQLTGIPKSVRLTIGDTVLTSNISLNFPPGLMVGTIARVEEEKGGNNYILQIKPGANFNNLQFVNVIENIFLKEQAELEARVKKN